MKKESLSFGQNILEYISEQLKEDKAYEHQAGLSGLFGPRRRGKGSAGRAQTAGRHGL